LIALGQYLSMCAVVLVSAAVAVDRQRAERILFALTAATAAIALIVLVRDLIAAGAGLYLYSFSSPPAIACASVGLIIAAGACIRTIERYETRRSTPHQSSSILLWAFAGSIAALAICAAALVSHATYGTIFASGCGLAALVCFWIIRRFELGLWGTTAIAVLAVPVALLLISYHPPKQDATMALAFAETSGAQTAPSKRMLEDAPLLGTGAGTFAALAPIYREIDESPPGSVAATTAATFAIELGKPMFWLITIATAVAIVLLLRASLHRMRDSFYSAMGGGCLTAVLLAAFTAAGLLGIATELIVAAVLGLALAQSESRAA
jgi:hypothetical protein